jgi:RHH-type transcriptional regulator, proline utilization regulon repressor / proline dehydrogenase / delta 1-pyrroline-5-carboxylate dehydrogenase
MEKLNFIDKAKAAIESVKGKPLDSDERRRNAIDLAALLLNEARGIQSHIDKKHQAEMARLMDDLTGKAFTTSATDQCFRSVSSTRVANQFIFLLKKFGMPKFFSFTQKLQLFAFKLLGRQLSCIFVPLAKRSMRKRTSHVIVDGEDASLEKFLEKRKEENVRINLNRLGEAILGEKEAAHRLQIFLSDLKKPEIEYISVKISTIYSQLNLLSHENTAKVLSERLKILFRTAKTHFYTRPDGKSVPKFVNLDMEEYRDLHLTVDIFLSVLNDSEFQDFPAGIVLQSYLPDSYRLQQDLTNWAVQRVKNGGAPIKIRIVKGANLAMEQVEAALRNWPQAPYLTKAEVDANFKRMLIYGCKKEHAEAARLGIGSHNLFDISYALLLCSENEVQSYVEFEMLEGMADPMRRVVQMISGDMLLYCPAASEKEFQFAVAYLVRRLDENTAPDNFLRHAFGMIPGSQEWQKQASLFSLSCEQLEALSSTPNRQQNRLLAPIQPEPFAPFENEPNTDWSLPHNCEWAKKIIKTWQERKNPLIPLNIGSETIVSGKECAGEDPSNPNSPLYKYIAAEKHHLDAVFQNAEKGYAALSRQSVEARSNLLEQAAHHLRIKRSDLIGSMVADGGKTVPEADAEVSEAVDFAEYYRRNLEEITCLEDIHWKPKGVAVVAPPWNFPCSIPAGCILASLAAGNSVIFKPAPETVLVGWILVQCLWEAGISREMLQFFPCEDEPTGSLLIKDPRAATIILTGSTATAKLFLKMRLGLDLIAETGGKNAMIITSMADRELAVKDLIHSAFGHAGQKCSACSLAICEAEVYEDPNFRETLKDAASSLIVGSQWNLATKVNPLIKAAGSRLLKGLTTLEAGEEWLLEPKQDPHNPNLWSPGIKLGVKKGSFSHQKELFGPVLGVMKAEHLQHALELANATPYGLTAGLHSLDEREHDIWMDQMEAGNLYINRGMTGAIVQRQPFGGCKESCFGRGIKAGGPNYLMQLMEPEQSTLPKERENVNEAVHTLQGFIEQNIEDANQLVLWNASIGNYAFFMNQYFKKTHDPSCLLGQDNLLKYVPYERVTLRVQPDDSLLDILRIMAAAATCNTFMEISGDNERMQPLLQTDWEKGGMKIKAVAENEDELIQRMLKGQIKRLRLLKMPSQKLLEACAEAGCNNNIASVLANGRLELLHYLREVSISIDYHRYGNLGLRETEKRRHGSKVIKSG